MFSDAFEELCTAEIKSVEYFETLNKMILKTLAESLSEYLKSKSGGASLYGKIIKVSYIRSNKETCIAKYGTINYGRLKGFIEIYNTENKKVFRLFVSSMMQGGTKSPKLLAGFYKNYERKPNNLFNKEVMMVNEFVASLTNIHNQTFIAQLGSFLIDENHEYFTDPNGSPPALQ